MYNFEHEPELPIEQQIDPYHPDNQEFMKQVKSIQRVIVADAAVCRPKHVEVAKLKVMGKNQAETAEIVGLTPATVSRVLATRDVTQLITSLRYLSTLYEGPSMEQRKRFLWEIAVDSKNNDPRVAIQAIKELNNIDGVGSPTNVINNTTEITINQTHFPRSVLDDG